MSCGRVLTVLDVGESKTQELALIHFKEALTLVDPLLEHIEVTVAVVKSNGLLT